MSTEDRNTTIAPDVDGEIVRFSLGHLCRKVRQSRDLRQADIARLAGLPPSTVMRLEDGRTPEPRTFAGYVGVLCSPDAAGPLNASQASFLWRCFEAARAAGKMETALAALSLREVARRSPIGELRPLLDALASEEYPAYIRDDLFFIHAVNGPLLRVLDVAPDHPSLDTWPAWHCVASALVPGSPVAETHTADTYLPALARYVLRASYASLFTLQMTALMQRLSAMSPDGFAVWWSAALSLLLPEPPEALPTTLRMGGDLVQASIRRVHTARVELLPGHFARFTLGAWHTHSAPSEALLRDLGGPPGRQHLLLAADYDSDGSMHVNDWPEVRREWERRTAEGRI